MKLAMTVTVNAMDTQRWICRIQLFQFNWTSCESEPEADRVHEADSRLSSRSRWPAGRFKTKLLCVLGVQSLPAELHRLGTSDAADGASSEQLIQHIEADVPSGRTHRDEAAVDVGPQRQPRAATDGFEFPPHIEAAPVVLEHLRSIGSRHRCFGHVRRGRSGRSELYRGSNRTQASIGVEGRPLAQLRRVGERQPDFFRRMAQFSDENERPLLS